MNRFWKLLVLFIIGNDYAHSSDSKAELNILSEKISAPQITPSTGVTIHKRSDNFIDIEAPIERVWVGCTSINPSSKVSHLTIEIEDSAFNYSFGPRRAVDDGRSCLAKLKEFKAIMKNSKSVRVVGVSLSLYTYSKASKVYKNDKTPLRFRNKPQQISAFFDRFQVGEKCKSYFSDGCDLPKNYWAGTYPIK